MYVALWKVSLTITLATLAQQLHYHFQPLSPPSSARGEHSHTTFTHVLFYFTFNLPEGPHAERVSEDVVAYFDVPLVLLLVRRRHGLVAAVELAAASRGLGGVLSLSLSLCRCSSLQQARRE